MKGHQFLFLIIFGCLQGLSQEFKTLCTLPKTLSEASAVELLPGGSFIWTIEDAGNKPVIYAINRQCLIEREITLDELKNKDWEDLSSDAQGNLYIGDIGNNSKKRKSFKIYKLRSPEEGESQIALATIKFSLPKDQNSLDFEAFFVSGERIFLFSKQQKKTKVFKVPNLPGVHIAKLITSYQFETDHIRLTSAAINSQGTVIALLNHTAVWLLSEFEGTDFFGAKVARYSLGHDSQKEGICFDGPNSLLISDEYNQGKGGKLYRFTF